MTGQWSKRRLSRVEFALDYTAPGGTIEHLGSVRWAHRITHESLTADWIVDALNVCLSDVPARTWSWEPIIDTHRARLLHNGVELGEVEWAPHVPRGNKRRLMDRIVAAMNVERGRAWPCPEPIAPASAAPVTTARYVTADHDFATGADLVSRAVA